MAYASATLLRLLLLVRIQRRENEMMCLWGIGDGGRLMCSDGEGCIVNLLQKVFRYFLSGFFPRVYYFLN